MKKITFAFVAMAALMMAACGNKTKATQETADSTSFEEQQIKAGMNVQLDSLTACWLRLRPSAIYSVTKDGKLKLSDTEKKVKPDYLFCPDSLAGKLETLSAKYRAITVYFVDKQVADLYDESDIYNAPMRKLASELNDPAIKLVYEEGDKLDYAELNKQAYQLEEENGRANRFWETAATAIIEQTYIMLQSQDKFLASFTDKDAEDITYRIALLVDAFEELQQYNPELANLFTVIQPLEKLNAISVEQLREQLNASKDDIIRSRSLLFE